MRGWQHNFFFGPDPVCQDFKMSDVSEEWSSGVADCELQVLRLLSVGYPSWSPVVQVGPRLSKLVPGCPSSVLKSDRRKGVTGRLQKIGRLALKLAHAIHVIHVVRLWKFGDPNLGPQYWSMLMMVLRIPSGFFGGSRILNHSSAYVEHQMSSLHCVLQGEEPSWLENAPAMAVPWYVGLLSFRQARLDMWPRQSRMGTVQFFRTFDSMLFLTSESLCEVETVQWGSSTVATTALLDKCRWDTWPCGLRLRKKYEKTSL